MLCRLYVVLLDYLVDVTVRISIDGVELMNAIIVSLSLCLLSNVAIAQDDDEYVPDYSWMLHRPTIYQSSVASERDIVKEYQIRNEQDYQNRRRQMDEIDIENAQERCPLCPTLETEAPPYIGLPTLGTEAGQLPVHDVRRDNEHLTTPPVVYQHNPFGGHYKSESTILQPHSVSADRHKEVGQSSNTKGIQERFRDLDSSGRLGRQGRQ
jgi:hypothetical protein